MARGGGFYDAIKRPLPYDGDLVERLLAAAGRARVEALRDQLAAYLGANLPTAIRSKSKLADYRTSPYVLMTTAGALDLDDPVDLARFLLHLKMYMGLETSFGKSIESVVMPFYPVDTDDGARWHEAPEKVEEFDALRGLSREDRSRARSSSVWREVDRSCIYQGRRHLLTIKSGTSTINDTQVAAMKDAIRDHHQTWLESSTDRYGVEGIDIVIGLTYGTERTTNNKENQILNKLLDHGFAEVDRESSPGLLATADGRVRAYRKVGVGYWSYVGDPSPTPVADYVFVEVLLALALALRATSDTGEVQGALNDRLDMLADAIKSLKMPRDAVPEWVESQLTPAELVWFAAALTAFFDPSSIEERAEVEAVADQLDLEA